MIAADIEGASALATVQALTDMGGNDSRHTHFQVDVTSSEQVGQFMADIQRQYKKSPCISIHCHGITRDDFLVKMSEVSFNEVINVNLKVNLLILEMFYLGSICSMK